MRHGQIGAPICSFPSTTIVYDGADHHRAPGRAAAVPTDDPPPAGRDGRRRRCSSVAVDETPGLLSGDGAVEAGEFRSSGIEQLRRSTFGETTVAFSSRQLSELPAKVPKVPVHVGVRVGDLTRRCSRTQSKSVIAPITSFWRRCRAMRRRAGEIARAAGRIGK